MKMKQKIKQAILGILAEKRAEGDVLPYAMSIEVAGWDGYHSEEAARKAGEERLDAIRLADKLSEDGKTNVAYMKKMGAVLGVKVKNKDIVLRPLQNIRDFFEEGSELRHCVFTNGYYRHKDCLIIGARVNGKRTETIEIDTKAWKIVQCRGKHNQPSRHHTRIMKLMNKNMDIFKKAAL